MLATHLGHYNTATTRTRVRFQFSTHAAAGGNVAPNSAFEAADLRIYRAADGAAFSATQRSSANGITMTSPFGSLTGFHGVDIDLTDNTDAGFFAAGYLYAVVLAPDETVDGQTLTAVVLAYFEIGPQPVNVVQFGGTAGTFSGGRPEVNASHISGDSGAADNLENAFDDTAGPVRWNLISDQGTLQAITSTTSVTLAATASAEDDVYNGQTIHFPTATTGAKQSAIIDDYNGTTKVAILKAALPVALSGATTYKVAATPPSPANADIAAIKAKTDNLPTDPADASDIAGAFTTVNTKLDTIDDFLDTEIAAIKAKTDGLPADPADASDIATAFSGVNTKLDTIDDFLDTEVAAIKAVTDKLDDTLEDQGGGTYGFTVAALQEAPTGSGGTGLTAAQTRAALGMAAADLDDQLDALATAIADCPTNAELATALGTADDAVLSAVAAVSAKVDTVDDFLDTEIAALTTAVGDIPTNAELATALAAADDAVLSAVAAVSAKVDVVDDFLDTEVAAIKAKTDGLPSDPADASVIAGLISGVDGKIDGIKAKTDELTFTVAGEVDSRLVRVVSTALTPNGVGGQEYGG